ncbi:MAG: hypothetical protein ABR552_09085 [Actinomycetota bacterium]
MDEPVVDLVETQPVEEPEDDRVRFGDPAWDDEFCTWLDNGLRTCCG